MGLPLNLFKITLKLHHLLNTQNASALQQLLHLYLKQNKKQTKRKKEKKGWGKTQENTFKMLGCSASAQGVPGKALSCAVIVRGIGAHQPTSHENLHTTHYRRQRTTWWEAGTEVGIERKRHRCHAVVFSSERRH